MKIEIQGKKHTGAVKMRSVIVFFLSCFMLALLSGLAGAQQESVHVVPKFTFENGKELNNMKVGYMTWGKLNSAKDNAILLTPGTSSLKAWATMFVGSGKAYDPDKYYIISVDAIGGGTSSSPKDGLGIDFPVYTIRDIVQAQYDLVTKGLGLTQLLAVGGPSMGSFQGIEWGVTFPDFVKGLLLIVPAARSDRHLHALVDAIRDMITLDPNYANGRYTTNPTEGIKRSGGIYFPYLFSNAYLNSIKNDEDWQKARMAFGEAWAKVWDANSMLLRYIASRNFDVSAPYGGDMAKALGRVRAYSLVMPSTTDRAIPDYLTDEMVRHLNKVTYAPIVSNKGHLACLQPEGTPEYAFMTQRLKDFLSMLTEVR